MSLATPVGMMRTLGAAIGAVIVLLFLASVASKLTWSASKSESESSVSALAH